jgi:hypothetical protein
MTFTLREFCSSFYIVPLSTIQLEPLLVHIYGEEYKFFSIQKVNVSR